MVSDGENIQGATVWCGGNALLMSEVRGEQTGWRDPRKGTGTQITTGYNRDERKNNHFTRYFGKNPYHTSKKKKHKWEFVILSNNVEKHKIKHNVTFISGFLIIKRYFTRKQWADTADVKMCFTSTW